MVLLPKFSSYFLKALFLLFFTAACTSGCMHGVCAGDVDFWYDQILLTIYYQILILASMHSCSICYDGSPGSCFDQLIALHDVIPLLADRMDWHSMQHSHVQVWLQPQWRLLQCAWRVPVLAWLHWASMRDSYAPCSLSFGLCSPTHVFCRGTLLEHACHIIAGDCDFLPKCIGVLGSLVQHWIQELQGVLPTSLLFCILIHDWFICTTDICVSVQQWPQRLWLRAVWLEQGPIQPLKCKSSGEIPSNVIFHSIILFFRPTALLLWGCFLASCSKLLCFPPTTATLNPRCPLPTRLSRPHVAVPATPTHCEQQSQLDRPSVLHCCR
jgi:hypothetical protein